MLTFKCYFAFCIAFAFCILFNTVFQNSKNTTQMCYDCKSFERGDNSSEFVLLKGLNLNLPGQKLHRRGGGW